MKKRGSRTAKTKVTKTDRIAEVFSSNPLDPISPKEISIELGLDIKLVTTIVNRLKEEGTIERVGWGKYRLSIDNSIDDEILEEIVEDMFNMTVVILGSSPDVNGDDHNGSSFKNLINQYKRICDIGGELMAQNVLRLASTKKLPVDRVEALIASVAEVSQ